MFLDRSCEGDDLVRREVESLLSFYDDPPETATEPVRVRRRTQPKARYRKGHIVAGRYRIERMVGRGGMGEVYQAYDGLMRQPVALKVLHVSDDVHRRRLVEEVRLARQVTHAGVCRVHDVGEHEGSPFLTMELIQGVDLAARLARSGPLPSDEVTDIAVRLCRALVAAHDAGVLHRDLKPSNILIDRQGGIYITDFGIATRRARTVDARRSEAGRFGTPIYMAPEETDATASVTERTDLYSLGLVLYELLTGAPPFDDSDLDTLLELQRSAIPEPPSRRVAGVDATLEAVILHLLVKDPAGRPESARAVLTALSSERASTKAPETLPSQRERRPVLTLLCQLAAPPELVADPEWPELVRIFNARCTASCRLMGGRVVRHVDRGLVVRFGYPSAREQDAESAVRAGLDILADVRARPLVPAERGRATAAVVIETGSAVIQSGRVIETDRRGEESARLEALIEPDAVVVSATVLALVRDGFSSDVLERTNGGPARHRITGARQRLGLEAGAARLTPFAGRELELARLERWWREADDGKGRVVLITGEAGLGKSRIVHELWQRVRHQGMGLEARCSSFHRNTPLHPFVEMLTHAFGLDRTDAGEARQTKLHQGLAALGPRADELLPAFSAWLSLGGSAAAMTADAAPNVDRRVLIAAIIEWILALAETKPILLICEDVHWSDPTSREAIDRLVDQVRLARVMLVLTFRPRFSPPWKGTAVNHLDLQPLSADEARAMVAAAPEQAALDPASIVSRADGNPLFLEELIKDANDRATRVAPRVSRLRCAACWPPASTVWEQRGVWRRPRRYAAAPSAIHCWLCSPPRTSPARSISTRASPACSTRRSSSSGGRRRERASASRTRCCRKPPTKRCRHATGDGGMGSSLVAFPTSTPISPLPNPRSWPCTGPRRVSPKRRSSGGTERVSAPSSAPPSPRRATLSNTRCARCPRRSNRPSAEGERSSCVWRSRLPRAVAISLRTRCDATFDASRHCAPVSKAETSSSVLSSNRPGFDWPAANCGRRCTSSNGSEG